MLAGYYVGVGTSGSSNLVAVASVMVLSGSTSSSIHPIPEQFDCANDHASV